MSDYVAEMARKASDEACRSFDEAESDEEAETGQIAGIAAVIREVIEHCAREVEKSYRDNDAPTGLDATEARHHAAARIRSLTANPRGRET